MKNMNELTKNLLIMLGVIIAICLVGRLDYNEEVIYNMSEETYEALVEAMPNASESDLVDAYLGDKSYWDSVGRMRY